MTLDWSFCCAGGGLSWETSSERLRAYFENFGVVREAFVSYNRNNGRPRGFGFVVFESPEVADKVVASKHTIDRREVRAIAAGIQWAGKGQSQRSKSAQSSLLPATCSNELWNANAVIKQSRQELNAAGTLRQGHGCHAGVSWVLVSRRLSARRQCPRRRLLLAAMSVKGQRTVGLGQLPAQGQPGGGHARSSWVASRQVSMRSSCGNISSSSAQLRTQW